MLTAAALVLTGGRSRRFGAHKPAAELAGRPLVRHVLDAVQHLPTVVVGSAQAVPRDVVVVREDPPGAGPVAAIGAGLAHLPPATRVVVLAADLPLVTSDHVARLLRAAEDAALACFVDADQHRQWLCAAWQTPVLRQRLTALGDLKGQSLRRLAHGVPCVELTDPTGAAASDVDTPADLAVLIARASTRPQDD